MKPSIRKLSGSENYKKAKWNISNQKILNRKTIQKGQHSREKISLMDVVLFYLILL